VGICDVSTEVRSDPIKANGSSCDDATACTHTDVCSGAACAGTSYSCSDLTTPDCRKLAGATCNGDGECTFPADSSQQTNPCNDKNTQTYLDFCDGSGVCAGTPCDCVSPDICQTATDFTCDQTTAECTYPGDPNTVDIACDDADATTYNDTCSGAGVCVGTGCDCTTPNACQTTEGWTCEQAIGTCIYVGVPSTFTDSCDDTNAQTHNDTCNTQGVCLGTNCSCDSPLPCDLADGWACTDTTSHGVDSYVKLMLHMNGSNGSTTFTDSSAAGHTVTVHGDAKIATTPNKFGGASGAFDGDGDYLTIPDSDDWDFGDGDYTVEAWILWPAIEEEGVVTDDDKIVDGSNPFRFGFKKGSANNKVKIGGEWLGSSSQSFWAPEYTVANNTWYHVAWVRKNGTAYSYINGALQQSEASSFTMNSPGPIHIASAIGGGAPEISHVYLDELRISKGIARYGSWYGWAGIGTNNGWTCEDVCEDGGGTSIDWDNMAEQLAYCQQLNPTATVSDIVDPFNFSYPLYTPQNDGCDINANGAGSKNWAGNGTTEYGDQILCKCEFSGAGTAKFTPQTAEFTAPSFNCTYPKRNSGDTCDDVNACTLGTTCDASSNCASGTPTNAGGVCTDHNEQTFDDICTDSGVCDSTICDCGSKCAPGHATNADGTCTFVANISTECTHTNGGAIKYGTSVGWPPPEPGNNWWGSDSPGIVMHAKKTSGSGNSKMVGIVAFDTSGIPTSATVTKAKIRVYANTVNNPDALEVTGQWHLDNFCIGSNFYVEPPSGDAMPTTAVNLLKQNQWNEIHLTHVEKISKSGYSGLTFGINKTGWSPVADASPNEVYFDGRQQANPAQLVIIYQPADVITDGPNACQYAEGWTCDQNDAKCSYKANSANAGQACDDVNSLTWSDTCQPDGTCLGIACNCAGAQDICTHTGNCVCIPNCQSADGSDRECGTDGCLSTCGAGCAGGLNCTTDGKCQGCIPDCTTADGSPKICGDDSCGGVCGNCDTSMNTACAENTCSADQSQCTMTALNEAGGCDDSNACTDQTVCVNGACVADTNAGSTFSPQDTSCDDKSKQTHTDVCDDTGTCQGATCDCVGTHTVCELEGTVSWAQDILPLVRKNCTTCHSSDSTYGGPKIVTYADTQKSSSCYDGKSIGEAMALKVATDPGCGVQMPKDASALSADDQKLLADWVAGGQLEEGWSCSTVQCGAGHTNNGDGTCTAVFATAQIEDDWTSRGDADNEPATTTDALSEVTARKNCWGGNINNDHGLQRWDTSSLPDNATVQSAKVKGYTYRVNTDFGTRKLQCYYKNWARHLSWLTTPSPEPKSNAKTSWSTMSIRPAMHCERSLWIT